MMQTLAEGDALMLTSLVMLGFVETTMPHALSVGFFPDETDVRTQAISKQTGEENWPFAAKSGALMCVLSVGQRVVLFSPDVDLPSEIDVESSENRIVHVSADPLFLMTLGRNNEKHFAPNMTIEDKIRRLGPYVTMGKKLCDQPKGTVLGPSEL